MLSERISRLGERVRDTQPTLDLDRARLITEFYSQPSMDNYIMRRAKAFKYYLENMAIFIDDDEQIAGHQGGRIQSVVLYPDITKWLYDDFDTLEKRPSDNLAFRSTDDKNELWEIVNRWRGHTFGDYTAELLDDDLRDMITAGILTHGISNQSTMNHSPDYDNFVKFGKDIYFVCDVNMELVSNYVNLGKLIQDIYQYPYYIKINELDVKPYDKDKKILLTSLSLRLYAQTAPEEDSPAAEGAAAHRKILVWF